MRTFFEKNTLVSIAILFILLGPFLILTQYNLPSYDDYTVPSIINRMGYFPTQWYWYTKWSGSYASSGILALVHPLIYSKSGIEYYGLFSCLLIIGFVISLYRFVVSLIPSATIGYKLGALTGFLFVYLFEMPSPTEGFYWLVGAWTYSLGVIVALELGTQLISYNHNKTKINLGYMILLAVLLPGMSEVIVIIFIASYCLILSLIFFQRNKINRINYIILSILAIFTLVSFLAPGNSVRAENVFEAGTSSRDLSIVLPQTFKFGVQKMMHWTFIGPFMIIAFLSLSIISKIRPELLNLVNNWTKFGYWIIASNVFVFVFIFPVLWSSGIAPDRIYNPIALYYLFVTLISIFFIFNLLKIKRFEIPMPAVIMISIFLFGYTLTSQNKISRTWIEIRSGEAKSYYAEMQGIYKMCNENPGKKIVLSPMQNRPNTIFINDLNTDSTHWENRFFCKFHGIGSAYTGDSTISYVEPIK